MHVSPASASAVFRDREAMEIAVRALTERGIRPQRIYVSHGSTVEPVRTAHASTLLVGVAIGVASGAAMMLVWVYWLSTFGPTALGTVLLKTVYAAMTGGFVGGLLTLLAFLEYRLFRNEMPNDGGDFVVTVKPPSEYEAREVSALMALRGGDVIAAAPSARDPYRYRRLFA